MHPARRLVAAAILLGVATLLLGGRGCRGRSSHDDCADCRLVAGPEWEYAARLGTKTSAHRGDVSFPEPSGGRCEESPALFPIAWSCVTSGLEGVEEETATELGLEPGALRRHQQPGVADGHQLLDTGRVEVQRE